MTESVDILVVGAGVAGVPAAVAAARRGAGTLLVEQDSFPGGAGVSALHRHICGAHRGSGPGEPATPGDPLNAGITGEILEQLTRLSPESRPQRMGRVFVIPYDVADFQAVYANLLGAEADLRVLYGARLAGLDRSDTRINAFTLTLKDRTLKIRPRVVIDCTGQGAVIQMAGAAQPATPLPDRQLAGYTIRITGVRDIPGTPPAIHVPHALRAAVDQGRFPPHLRFTFFTPGRTPSDAFIKFSLPAGSSDPDAARRLAIQVHRYLAESIPALAESSIATCSSHVHEREGTRLLGRYTLTADDVIDARHFEDSVALNAWPIEYWHPEQGPQYRYLPPGKTGQIPLRCLQSASLDNLLAAGRCISVTPEALASTRVMAPCIALGEAAGLAAAKQCQSP